ncbi:MAG TPA: YihA family ribosome biogenesis GTP-binding protein [Deltaproteobacteria bacterium]|nr:YihA family ribosome biogenesis GTP-binding protein [Deltaproteobacteria bacterium]
MTASPRFLLFDPTGDSWPKVTLPQVAFAGRSNVGKSSLLNALVGHSRLARVGKTPGRTRGIAFFEIEGRFVFADLPGYGFAKVSRAEREGWKTLVEGYFSACRLLRKVYILVDIRRGPEEDEEMLAEYLSSCGVPYRFVGMKADKVKPREIPVLSSRFAGTQWLALGGPPVLVSARTREGIDLLWRDIRAVFSP